MEIKNNIKAAALNGTYATKRTPAPATTAAPDPFASSAALESALQSVPDVRTDAVARARQLIADPNYPSADTVKKLSQFLADKFSSAAE